MDDIGRTKNHVGRKIQIFYNCKQYNLDKSDFYYVCFLLGKAKLFKSELMSKVKKMQNRLSGIY